MIVLRQKDRGWCKQERCYKIHIFIHVSVFLKEFDELESYISWEICLLHISHMMEVKIVFHKQTILHRVRRMGRADSNLQRHCITEDMEA